MFNWLFRVLAEAESSGAFSSPDSYGSIISYVVVSVLGLIGTALGIIKKKAKPGSKWERLCSMLIKQNEKQIELTEEILKHDEKLKCKEQVDEQKQLKDKKDKKKDA